MFQTTEGILIKKTKLSGNRFILKLYTKDFGIKSFFARKSKKEKSVFQSFSILSISSYNNSKNSIQNIKESFISVPFVSIYTNIYKSNIILFINEVLNNILKEEEENEELYNFIKISLIKFDKEELNINFHLIFLMQLTQFLGIEPFPEGEELTEGFYDFEEGHLVSIKPLHSNYLTVLETNNFRNLYYYSFSISTEFSISNTKRKEIINSLIKYYQYHTDMRNIKSLGVLEVVFG